MKNHVRGQLARIATVALLAAALAAVALQTSPSASHSWNGYHWARTANPFTVKLGNNVASAWNPFLSTASADWSASDVLNTTIVTGGTRPRNCKATSGRVEVCNATYGFTGWLGVAQIWVSGSHITQGTVKMNDSYFNSATYNSPAWRQMVMCQEVGHTFGLDHQDENFDNPNLGTCMDYTSDPSTNMHPNSHDYEELDIIYAHPDSFTTIDATQGAAASGAVLDNPSEWGQLMRTTHGAKTQVFERDFGNGDKIVTFVIWA